MIKISITEFSIFLLVFWITFIGVLLIVSLRSPFNMDFETKQSFRGIFPEGWSFFTRNPREETLHIYIRNENNEFVENSESCSNAKYLFGISRDCRIRNVEISSLSLQVNDSLWINGNTDRFILEANSQQHIVVNKFRNPTINGEVFLVKKQRIPWAWASDFENIVMPYKLIRLHVK